jgi:hypothetical protein
VIRCNRMVVLKCFELTSELHIFLEEAHKCQVLDSDKMSLHGLPEHFLIENVSVMEDGAETKVKLTCTGVRARAESDMLCE